MEDVKHEIRYTYSKTLVNGQYTMVLCGQDGTVRYTKLGYDTWEKTVFIPTPPVYTLPEFDGQPNSNPMGV